SSDMFYLYSYVLSLSSFFFLFFIIVYLSTLIRDLHSFPTRRSSDLSIAGTRQAVSEVCINLLSKSGTVNSICQAVSSIYIWISRSEEHTSELQSRFDLVCRLLLEKKK